MLRERIASQSEAIGAIVSGYSTCCGVPHHRKAAQQTSQMKRVTVSRTIDSMISVTPSFFGSPT